ncbi:enoyl-CoA hydratase/isomerase family protein [Parageobacillus thermoglucosidasius]|uniref:Enoyl-CoA hydratase n=2 Tax=Anoxybacillaceae TaxID=3120669 RepID=A0AAN0YQT8_PARTM|nr:enoyl-CoA hydratase-related protein [Parageobacillus thermoglucosidasius]KYD15974.1 Enoyl-CoA hydratase [Anoxybacillus flavithermus]REK58228.1 MAG: enoyl-CoA hydratase [Geobacillus sp.]AEH47559.1 Enoyl-CoA hydratase/isomerase [Parageobacillus thermoglucosidasius C56-YS93]ALF11203.1 enoyl-CoA hydratase [Parageobacillus thermoglucosidasius]ANZ31279.1 enoyl-CoA hydratase [Parageobacillus thermoglucosidasius]
MTEFAHIRTHVDENVAVIELHRPDVLNALNRKMVTEIVSAMEFYDRDEHVRVIVLTGSGRAFAAGADIDEMANDDSITLELLNQFAEWDRLALIKKPTIAAVHGFALGGGFELALSCDLLFAADTAEFGFPEVNIGVMPGAGGTQRLTKLIGKTKALEWLWTGERMSAKEAHELGIVNRVIAPELLDEETMRFAKKLAKQPPLSVRLIKEAVNKAVDYSLYEGMQFERKNFYLLFSSEDQKEGMAAFIEKRKPRFQGR